MASIWGNPDTEGKLIIQVGDYVLDSITEAEEILALKEINADLELRLKEREQELRHKDEQHEITKENHALKIKEKELKISTLRQEKRLQAKNHEQEKRQQATDHDLMITAEKQRIESRVWGRRVAYLFFSFSMLATITILVLQGFEVGGFNLPETTINNLSRVIIGQTALLIAAVFGFMFGSTRLVQGTVDIILNRWQTTNK